MKDKTIYKVRSISIDVADNDPVDVRCGGPARLGFDFIVEAKTIQFWEKTLNVARQKHLEKHGKDFQYFRSSIGRSECQLKKPKWTPEKLTREITNYI